MKEIQQSINDMANLKADLNRYKGVKVIITSDKDTPTTHEPGGCIVLPPGSFREEVL